MSTVTFTESSFVQRAGYGVQTLSGSTEEPELTYELTVIGLAPRDTFPADATITVDFSVNTTDVATEAENTPDPNLPADVATEAENKPDPADTGAVSETPVGGPE